MHPRIPRLNTAEADRDTRPSPAGGYDRQTCFSGQIFQEDLVEEFAALTRRKIAQQRFCRVHMYPELLLRFPELLHLAIPSRQFGAQVRIDLERLLHMV